MSTQPDSKPAATAEAPDKGVGCDALLAEIRATITDQINRHVAMTQEHRAWLAQDIAGRVCALVGEMARDSRRLDILENCIWCPKAGNGLALYPVNQLELTARLITKEGFVGEKLVKNYTLLRDLLDALENALLAITEAEHRDDEHAAEHGSAGNHSFFG